jgi:phage shock protein C
MGNGITRSSQIIFKKSANSLSLHHHFVYMKRLYRSRKEQILGGVCGGLGEHIDVDPSIIRLVWVIATLLSLGTGIIVYLAAWIIIPESPDESLQQTPVTA